MASPADLGQLNIDDFAPHLNAIFEMDSPHGKVPLRLAEAAAHGHPLPETVTTDAGKKHKVRDGGGFTLQFVAPESSRLQQGIYPIKHPKLGTIEIFLVPTGPVHDGHGFHAVFG
ncbi:MAG TPA: hypothetical protein VD863_13570 [Bradyrhizobium sp.]|nr:hypothetical protein [Bradyrhizobium sp.]